MEKIKFMSVENPTEEELSLASKKPESLDKKEQGEDSELATDKVPDLMSEQSVTEMKGLEAETTKQETARIRQEIAAIAKQEKKEHDGRDPHHRFGYVTPETAKRLRMMKKKR